MLVTESGIVIVLRFSHNENAPPPMFVTESGIVIDERLEHSLNA